MNFIKKTPVSIRITLAGFVILFFLFFLIRLCFFSSGIQAENNRDISYETPYNTQKETGNIAEDISGQNPESHKTEPEDSTQRSLYLLSGQTLDMAAAQLGSTAFRLPFTLKDVPCEYVTYDNSGTLPQTVTPNQLHILTVCVNNSYFRFQLYTDTECPLEEATVTGVSESDELSNKDHLYLPNGIFIGESTDTLTGFSSTSQVFGITTHRYQDSLGQKIIVYSKNGIITSVGIYAPE